MTGGKELFRLSRISQVARVLICVEFALAVGAIVYVGFHVLRDVLAGSPVAIPVRIDGSCEGSPSNSSCKVISTELNSGRYRIVTDAPATRLTLTVSPDRPGQSARVMLLRLSRSQAVRLDMRTGADAPIGPIRLDAAGSRTTTALPFTSFAALSLTFAPESDTSPRLPAIDEVAFFANTRGVVSDDRWFFPWIPTLTYYGTLVPRAIGRLCAFTIIAAFVFPSPILKRLNPVVLALVCFALCLLDLAILFSPYGRHDLRLFYASGPLQEPAGTNLNVSLWQGSRLLQGEGLTFSRGLVPWQRMPGYALFCTLAGLLFGHSTLVDLAVGTVLLQVLFYSSALGLFAWAAGLLWSPPVVWTLGLLIALLPKQLGYTQVDSIIAPVMLLILASLCMRLSDARNGGSVRLTRDVFVHLTFALWFVMRPDVLPGWLIVSLVLHWRSWRRLLIPLTLFLAIGCSWGAYRARFTKEFNLTTSSTGASLFCGLWEVPSRFALTCSDTSYFEWIHEHTGFDPQSQAANSFAIRQVLRFWLTFPGHFVLMLDHKMMQCLDDDFWPGLRTDLQQAFFQVSSRAGVTLGLLTVMALSLAVGYQRRRTLLLGWPLFFNGPLFWVMFASLGRFYSAVPIGMFAGAVPTLFERQFYASLIARPWRTASVLLCAVIFAIAAWPFHDWLLRNDAFHYWTPFLEPAKSALSGFK